MQLLYFGHLRHDEEDKGWLWVVLGERRTPMEAERRPAIPGTT
jgi:hypothetical protein